MIRSARATPSVVCHSRLSERVSERERLWLGAFPPPLLTLLMIWSGSFCQCGRLGLRRCAPSALLLILDLSHLPSQVFCGCKPLLILVRRPFLRPLPCACCVAYLRIYLYSLAGTVSTQHALPALCLCARVLLSIVAVAPLCRVSCRTHCCRGCVTRPSRYSPKAFPFLAIPLLSLAGLSCRSIVTTRVAGVWLHPNYYATPAGALPSARLYREHVRSAATATGVAEPTGAWQGRPCALAPCAYYMMNCTAYSLSVDSS